MTTQSPAARTAPILAGITGAVTGFASSFAIVLAGAIAIGATPEQAASGLLMVSLSQGIVGIVLSLRYRIPISIAWSTPGAAVLVGGAAITNDFGIGVSAFLLTAIMLLVTALVPALARFMTRIPAPIGSAMLAGILFPICLAPVTAAVEHPYAALPAIIVWLVLSRIAPRWSVPAAVAAMAIAIVVMSGGSDAFTGAALLPTLELVAPSVADPLAIVSLAIPLYLVTMAGQNIPGFTVLRTFEYTDIPARAILGGTGFASLVTAPFGAQTVNLSALSAAIMVGDEHTPRDRRWIATVTGGVVYILLGLGAGAAGSLVSASPPILIEAVAGLALFGALISAVMGALEDPHGRIVAIGTFLVVASGITLAGFGSAFWGLVIGALLWLVLVAGKTRPTPATGR